MIAVKMAFVRFWGLGQITIFWRGRSSVVTCLTGLLCDRVDVIQQYIAIAMMEC